MKNAKERKKMKHFILEILFVSSFVFLFGLSFFWVFGGFDYFADKVDLRISFVGPVKSVGLTTVIVDYGNRYDFALKNAELKINLPKNFELISASDSQFDLFTKILNISELSANDGGRLTLVGRLWQDFGSKNFLAANLIYYKTDKQGQKSKDIFEKNTIFDYQIGDSIVELSENCPSKVFGGESVVLTATVKNLEADLPLENLFLQKEFPNDFAVEQTDEERFSLSPNSQIEKQSRLILPNQKGEKKYGFALYLETLNGRILLNKIEKVLQVVESPVIFNITSEKNVFAAGEKIKIKIEMENVSGKKLVDNKVRLDFGGGFWQLQNGANGFLEFDKKDFLQLSSIKADEKIEFSLDIETKSVDLFGEDEIFVKPLATIIFENEPRIITGIPTKMQLIKKLSLFAYPVYFSAGGDQLGRGPLPPQVGQQTKYWFFTRVLNDFSQINDVEVKIKLDTNVQFTGNSDVFFGEPVIFDPVNNEIIWKIKTVLAQENNFGFGVELAVSPNKNDLGKYPILVKSLEISGIDSTTGEVVRQSYGQVTTQLLNDEKGMKLDGVVR